MSKFTFANIRLFVVFSIIALLNLDVQAQEDDESPFSISGTVDAYFRTNFNGLNKTEYDANEDPMYYAAAPATSFANDPGFAIGMANVIMGYEGDKVGFVADLVFGPRGEDAVFLSTGSAAIVNQLYVYYNLSDNVRLTFGNFNTFLGYEVISPAANFNYSTSYMFSYGPFSHTGLKADFTIDENWSAMLAVMNPTDYTEFNPVGKYTFGGQLGYANDAGSAYLNLIYGEQWLSDDALFQVDLTTGWDLSDTFYLGFNGTYQTTDGEGFAGAAIYPQLSTSDSFAIGLRAEYFNELSDGEGLVYGADANTTAFTLTGSYTYGNLMIKPELRLDSVDGAAPFVDSDLMMQDNLSSFLVAAIYSF
ncbi:Putative beta-barrel porin-2, OmpL-like. bbp2 [Zunongwangia mangrovi]|uniref:Putative beta-barrel porin-2, OmpL-like. bbp2 n=1 Tax=Zunongwangia mangrovi TaxID=1334022 RepID=A0A1I1HRA5_9FLAO|nr:outer membrane beta-barrel protein [Zunongwangia mangrovi]SFC23540.1 Putative beta-barrel porin-2, OmpL-like. bbp2 [Zunongwangia mangrovi]